MAEEKKQPSADKLKALQLAMAKIDKDFGKGAIMKLGDDKIEDIAVIPTGSIGLNLALGVGVVRSAGCRYPLRVSLHRSGRTHALHR